MDKTYFRSGQTAIERKLQLSLKFQAFSLSYWLAAYLAQSLPRIMDKNEIYALLVEDNPGDVFLFKEMLQQAIAVQFKIVQTDRLERAIQHLDKEKFDVILLDLSLPDSQGLSTLLRIKKRAERTPIVVLTGFDNEMLALESVRLGAQDYLVKEQVTVEILVRSIRYALERFHLVEQLCQTQEKLEKFNQELQRRVEARTAEIQAKNQQLQHLLTLSTTDKLTGIANRYALEYQLQQEWEKGSAEATPLSVIMIDIDFFKLYNDTYGHQQGDWCLRQVARAIAQSLKRTKDVATRYGGEEFLTILPDTNSTGATAVARRIREQVQDLKIIHKTSQIGSFITVSLGVASTIPTYSLNWHSLISAADRALYVAKQNGRNCLEVALPKLS